MNWTLCLGKIHLPLLQCILDELHVAYVTVVNLFHFTLFIADCS